MAARAAAGRRRDPDLNLATLLDATERHAASSTLGPTRPIAAAELRVIGFPAALLVGLPAYLLGPWHWLLPAAGLLALGVYAAILRAKANRLAAHVRARAAGEQDAGW